MSSLPEITEPTQAWMLLCAPAYGQFMVWEITVTKGPVIRQRRKAYLMKSSKKLLWSFQNREETKSKKPMPEVVFMNTGQIAFTQEELIQKFEAGRAKFAKHKQGDVVRVTSNIVFMEKELAAYRECLERDKNTKREAEELLFPEEL